MANPPPGTSPIATAGPFAEVSGVVAPFTSGTVMTGAAASSSTTWNTMGEPEP